MSYVKFLFYDSLQNSDPIFNDRRLLVSILSQLLDYHPSISISLALSIILDKVQLREKCFFEKIKVHSLCWHAGSFAFNANRVGVEKVIHSEAHINVLNRNVVWQIEKHFWLKNIFLEDITTSCEVKCCISLFRTLEHSLKSIANMHLNLLGKMGLAEAELILVNLSRAVSCLTPLR